MGVKVGGLVGCTLKFGQMNSVILPQVLEVFDVSELSLCIGADNVFSLVLLEIAINNLSSTVHMSLSAYWRTGFHTLQHMV